MAPNEMATVNAIAEYKSLADSAIASGKTKSTIFRRVKNTDEAKKIIAVQNDAGESRINTQSLMRHYRLKQDGIACLDTQRQNNAPMQRRLQTQHLPLHRATTICLCCPLTLESTSETM